MSKNELENRIAIWILATTILISWFIVTHADQIARWFGL